MKTRNHLFVIISLTALYIVLELVFFESNLEIIKTIPGTDIRVFGLLILLFTFIALRHSLKTAFLVNPKKSVLNLTILGGLICLLPLLSLQIVRYIIDTLNHSADIVFILSQAVKIFIAYLVLSFLIAFQIVTKNTKILLLIILGIFIFAAIVFQLK